MADEFTSFKSSFSAFLVELENNNDKAWFQSNKSRYQDEVQEPARAFIRSMAPRIAKISKHIVVDDAKVGGSMMRIYRDTRFSKDKRPYNTHVSMRFRHAAGKGVDAPGFYCKISATEATFGTGIWQPEKEALAAIRNRIVDKPLEWKKARDAPEFLAVYGELAGDSLKRAPKGFDPEHKFVDDLRRKDFCAFYTIKSTRMRREEMTDELAASYKASNKLMRFLCKALELDY